MRVTTQMFLTQQEQYLALIKSFVAVGSVFAMLMDTWSHDLSIKEGKNTLSGLAVLWRIKNYIAVIAVVRNLCLDLKLKCKKRIQTYFFKGPVCNISRRSIVIKSLGMWEFMFTLRVSPLSRKWPYCPTTYLQQPKTWICSRLSWFSPWHQSWYHKAVIKRDIWNQGLTLTLFVLYY